MAVDIIGIVPEDEKILISTNIGNPASLENSGKNGAGTAFRNIARRIRGEEVPYLSLEVSKGLFSGLRRLFGGN